MAGVYNITIEQGATWRVQLNWQDSENETIPLDGYSAHMLIRYGSYDGDVAVELSTENGMIIIEDGQIVIEMPANVTATLLTARAVYDLKLTKDSEVIRLLQGSVSVSREVVRG